ncbi:MAG TPA: chorismate mutase [Lachnospiraceae bacterium]|nr:chorismate mutase [Lachnospiraceae bacterium]
MAALDEVRTEIDRVDGEIRKLFVERMALADRVAQIKAENGDVIFKPDREAAMIEKQCAGMDGALVMEYRAFLKRMIAVSRKYQYRRMLELRGGFPYEYDREEPACRNVVSLNRERSICGFASADEEIALLGLPAETLRERVDSYREMGRRILEGKADAGIGILEEIGCGVSDGMNALLVRCGLYIYKCEVRQTGDVRQKVVLFGKGLVVRPEHNRVKLAFVCPNTSGSLANVLSMIADHGINLTEIHSVPFREEEGWNYRFFVEMGANLEEKNAQALICQLYRETGDLQLLGSYYCKGDFE